MLRYVLHLLVVASFIVPLIVAPRSFIFPFIVPKVITFRIIVALMTAVGVLLLVAERKKIEWYKSPIIIAVMLFVLSFAFSTVVGTDPYHSFWDNHERMLGLFTILHYGLYFLVLTTVYTSWKEWRWILRGILVAGSIVMFIGVIQIFNPFYLLNQGSTRVASTLGNSIYVGGYGLFLFFTAVLLALHEKNIFWKIGEVCAGFLALVGILYSGSRGSILGLGTGILVALVAYVITLKQAPRLRYAIGGLLVVGALGAAFLYSSRHAQWVADIPALERTLNSGVSDTINSPRWIAWQIAWESWLDKPIFGWGPNNFFYAFNAFYHPKSLEYGYGETWFDNAHNIIMNTLAVQGIVGLLTYVGIFVVSWVMLIRGYRKGTVPLHIAIIGASFLVAHFVQNVTVFENPTSYLYFMLWLAMVNALSKSTSTGVQSVVPNGKSTASAYGRVSAGLASGVLGVALVFIFIFDIQPARANMAALQALMVAGDASEQSLVVVERVLQSHSPHVDDIRADLSRTLIQSVEGLMSKISPDIGNKMLGLAREALTVNIELHPLDIRNQLMLAQLEQTAARMNNDPKYLAAAEAALNMAIQNSPKRQQVIYALAWVKAQRGDVQGSVGLLQQALDEDPKIGESYWRLMFILKNVGMPEQANKVWALAQTNQVHFTDQEMGIINSLISTSTPATSKPATTPKTKAKTK